MHKLRRAAQKFLVFIAFFAMLVQSLNPFLYVLPQVAYAQEATVTPTDTPSDTPTVTPDQNQTVTPTPTPADSVTPTDTPTPAETVTPTPVGGDTSTVTPDQTQPNNNSPPSGQSVSGQNSSNSSNSNSPTSSITPTITVAPTVTPAPDKGEGGKIGVAVLKDVSAPSIDLQATNTDSSATLTTDKSDYAPTDTALITGSNFSPNKTYSLTVSSNDAPATSTTANVTTNDSGSFVYAYQLDGKYRPNYKVEVKDASGTVVASTTFTDSASVTTTVSGVACVGDQPGQNGLVCTANDINLASVSPTVTINGHGCRFPGDTVNFTANYQIQSNANNRYNAGVWFATNGQASALHGTCSATSLPSTPNPPFFDGGTSCGGINKPDIGTITITQTAVCNPDSSGFLTIPYCTTWQQNSNNACTTPTDTVPGTGSKCNCPAGGIEIPITVPPAIEVIKSLSPSNDSGLFNLLVNAITKKTDATNGGTTGKVGVTTGQNTFGEANGTGTNLSNYASVASCVLRGTSTTVAITGTGPTWTITNVTNGQDIVCTITNTANNGTIELKKVWSGTGGQTTLTIGSAIGGNNVANTQTGAIGSAPLTTGPKTVNSGSYYLNETGGLTNYTPSALTCFNDANNDGTNNNGESSVSVGASNAVAVSANQHVICSFTNTRDQGTIELKKVWSGTGGQTTLNIGTSAGGTQTASVQTGASGAAPLTTGTQTVDTNTYYISENGGLTDYSSVLACTDNGSTVTPGANNSLNVAKNHAVICTFTNTRNTGTIKVIKDVVAPNGSPITDTSTNFAFSVDGGSTFDLTDGGNHSTTVITGANHTVVETPNANYDFAGCTSDSQTQGSAVANGIVVTVTTGTTSTVTCTNKQKHAKITVVKVVKDASGKVVSDSKTFTVQLNGASDDSTLSDTHDVVYNPNPGTYTVSEANDANYDNLGCKLNADLTATNFSLASNQSVTVTCTNKQKPGSILGVKTDENNNLLPNWTIQLASCLAGFTNCVDVLGAAIPTDNNGAYLFSNLVTGFYQVYEIMQAGWTNVTALFHNVEIQPGTVSSNNNFQNKGNLRITACKYEDADANNQTTEDRTPVNNWSFTLSGEQLGENVTQSAGEESNCTTFTDLKPGAYQVDEKLASHTDWSVVDKNGDVQDVTLTNESTTVNFYNYRKAHIIVKKDVVNPDGGVVTDTSTNFDFRIHQGGDIVESFSLVDGATSSTYDVNPGTYDVNEVLNHSNYSFGSCTAVYDGESIGRPVTEEDESGEQVSLDSNDTVTVTCINKQKTGRVHGYKWNDENGDGKLTCTEGGEFPTCESKLSDWTIFVDSNNNKTLDEGEQSTTTDSSGNYSFTLNPGTYNICEVVKTGWEQTYPGSGETACHTVTISSNQNSEQSLNFGNKNVIPAFTIAKTNDTEGASKAPGDVVNYTLTLTLDDTKGPGDNITVTDLLPKGFVYNGGSYQAFLNGNPISVEEPTYHSPGTWTLPSAQPGDVFTLKYKATVDSGQQSGTYYDNAWGQGTPVGDPSSTILALAGTDGNIGDPNFVGTQVSVSKEDSQSPSIAKTQGQVLGASTEALPSTGANTFQTALGIIVLIIGLNLLLVGFIIRKRYV